MDIGYIVSIIGIILVSMTLHEAMHGFMAYYLGDMTAKREGRLTFNPLQHIDPFLTIILPVFLAIVGAPIFGGAKPVPFNPQQLRYGEWGVALVGLAGPLTNFLLAFMSFGLFTMTSTGGMEILSSIFLTSVYVNLGFFLFNMLPIPPLDGSRVLYVFAPEFIRRGMIAIERSGILIVFLLVMVGSGLISSILVSTMTVFIRLFQAIFGMG
jgi:Zn-dependent protease